MTVFLLVGRLSVAVTGMVTAPLPQSKVMTPPRVAAAWSLLKLQLSWVPVPTTVVGLEVSAGWPLAGTPVLHEPLGFPALVTVPASLVFASPCPPVPLLPPVLPPVWLELLPPVLPGVFPPAPPVALLPAPPVALLPAPPVALLPAPPVALLPAPPVAALSPKPALPPVAPEAPPLPKIPPGEVAAPAPLPPVFELPPVAPSPASVRPPLPGLELPPLADIPPVAWLSEFDPAHPSANRTTRTRHRFARTRQGYHGDPAESLATWISQFSLLAHSADNNAVSGRGFLPQRRICEALPASDFPREQLRRTSSERRFALPEAALLSPADDPIHGRAKQSAGDGSQPEEPQL